MQSVAPTWAIVGLVFFLIINPASMWSSTDVAVKTPSCAPWLPAKARRVLIIDQPDWATFQQRGGGGEGYWAASLHLILKQLGFEVEHKGENVLNDAAYLSAFYRIVFNGPKPSYKGFADPAVFCRYAGGLQHGMRQGGGRPAIMAKR